MLETEKINDDADTDKSSVHEEAGLETHSDQSPEVQEHLPPEETVQPTEAPRLDASPDIGEELVQPEVAQNLQNDHSHEHQQIHEEHTDEELEPQKKKEPAQVE